MEGATEQHWIFLARWLAEALHWVREYINGTKTRSSNRVSYRNHYR